MRKLAVINIVGLTPSLIGTGMPNLSAFLKSGKHARLLEPFPAVTCTSQACMLTGVSPNAHGIVGNGWYFKDLAEVGFWKQNNGLVQSEKVWETIQRQKPGFTCAKLFWWFNMYSSANWSVTPRPDYPADGRKVFGIYTQPGEMGKQLEDGLGRFPFINFWGPAAGLPATKWISRCARWVFERHRPDLNLVYLPHLDYCLQKYGPESSLIKAELLVLDSVAGELLDFYRKHRVSVMVVSEYGITKVRHCIHPNRVLRQEGLLQVKKSLDWELLDCGASEAFGVSDHQACHVYVRNKSRIPEIESLLSQLPGQKAVISGSARSDYNLDHERAGDIILMANSDSWYSYYYWLDEALAPDFARCVDIHRKPGYDPLELFLDPAIRFPKIRILRKLMLMKLGFRTYMDIIPLNTELVQGSHGNPVENPEEGPLVICNFPEADKLPATLPMTGIRNLILSHFGIS